MSESETTTSGGGESGGGDGMDAIFGGDAPAEVAGGEAAEAADFEGAPDLEALAGPEDTGGIVDEPEVDEDSDEEGGDEEGEPEPEPELHRVKIDGRELDVTTEELIAGYQTARSSTNRYKEAAQIRKETQQFVAELAKGDPDHIAALFKRIGVNFDQVAETYLTRKLEELQMPPAERGMRELERERAAFERERQRALQQSQEAQIEREAQQYQAVIRQEMADAFAGAGVQPTRALEMAVMREMSAALNDGHQMDAATAVRLVVEDLRSRVGQLGPADLEAVMGREQADAMRREAGRKAAQAQRKRRAAPAQAAASRAPSQGIAPVDPADTDALHALFNS